MDKKRVSVLVAGQRFTILTDEEEKYVIEIAAKIDREVASILAKCYEKAKEILRDQKDKLELLTQALLEQETLNRAEFVSLMETGTIGDDLGQDKPRTTAEILKETPAETPAAEEKTIQQETESSEKETGEPAGEKEQAELKA